jgi:hypothetical protein
MEVINLKSKKGINFAILLTTINVNRVTHEKNHFFTLQFLFSNSTLLFLILNHFYIFFNDGFLLAFVYFLNISFYLFFVVNVIHQITVALDIFVFKLKIKN